MKIDFKIQKNISISVLGFFIICILLWYFVLHSNISSNLYAISTDYEKINKRSRELERMEKKMETVIKKFSDSKGRFTDLLKRIPSLDSQDQATDVFTNIIAGHSLRINAFIPSEGSIEEKKLFMAESGETISINKYAIDVVLTGDFLSFGRFLDYIENENILVNLTNLSFKNSEQNNIKFLAFLYFQEGNTDPNLIGTVNDFDPLEVSQSSEPDNKQDYIGGITTISWKGEEVVVGIDNPQYTSEGIEIYSIEYSDGRKEFVERSKLPPSLFNESEPNTNIENDNVSNTLKGKQEVLQLKTQFSDQLVKLEEKIKGFKSDQDEQQKKHEQELQKVEQEYKKQLSSIKDEFEKQIVRQEKKITAFEEQEKLKEELKKMDKNKLEKESTEKIESLQFEFDNELRKLQAKISSFEASQEQQSLDFEEQKRSAERSNRSKLKSMQEEFEYQLREQQQKITAFESMQAQQKKEKQNQEETNKENQRQLNEMQREFEIQLREQQKKISAFESLQLRQQQDMAEKKLIAKQANKEKLAEIQQEFINQLQKKENQITNITSQLAVKPTQNLIPEKKKPDLTPADKKALERKKMKAFIATLKELEAQEKIKSKQQSISQNKSIRPVTIPVRKITPRLEQDPIISYDNLDNVFENMSIDGIYRFQNGNQKLEIIIITSETENVVQVKTGNWETPGIWKNNYRNLTAVRIIGDKLFSSEQNGEFIFYEDMGELKRGLRMENLWTGKKIDSDYAIGRRIGSIDNYYQGNYPYTSIRVLKKSELENMSSRIELNLMRNEIFARYGYKFEPNGFMDQHFNDQPWYQPQYEDVTPFLTDIEIQNVNQIKGTEIDFIEAVNFLKSFAN